MAEYSVQDHFALTWLHPFFIGLCAFFVVGLAVILVVTAWCLFMALSGVALIVSSVASRVGIAAAIGTIWTLVTYVLDVIPMAVNSPLAWLNPWHHYYPPGTIAGGSTGWTGLIILLGWTVAATLTAMALYGRRDLV